MWGIIGALIMRGIMIAAGAALVARFSWILPVFGVFLVYTGVHMIWTRDKEVHYERNPVFQFARKHLRITEEYNSGNFFVRRAGQLFGTPLLLVLLIVEITDVTFAVDSIPAIFGITRDAFIVYTSNVFAIFGIACTLFPVGGHFGLFSVSGDWTSPGFGFYWREDGSGAVVALLGEIVPGDRGGDFAGYDFAFVDGRAEEEGGGVGRSLEESKFYTDSFHGLTTCHHPSTPSRQGTPALRSGWTGQNQELGEEGLRLWPFRKIWEN